MTETTWAYLALVLFGIYALLVFGLRTWLQIRKTGDSGFRGISGRPGSAEWWGGVLFVVAMVATVAAPVAALLGLGGIDDLLAWRLQAIGFGIAMTGIVATVVAQVAMGESWRIGVDASEETGLVTTGAFAVVRNPIFSAMVVAGIGLTLLVPNIVAIVALAVLIAAIEIQVRVVEEPYLARAHGAAWLNYAARVGRFVPRLQASSRAVS